MNWKVPAIIGAAVLTLASTSVFSGVTITRQNQHDDDSSKSQKSVVSATKAANSAAGEAYRATGVFASVCTRFNRDEANDRADAADLAEIVSAFPPPQPKSLAETALQAALRRAVRRAKKRREIVKRINCRKAMQAHYSALPTLTPEPDINP